MYRLMKAWACTCYVLAQGRLQEKSWRWQAIPVERTKAAAKKVVGVAGYSWSVPRVGHINKEVVNPCE